MAKPSAPVVVARFRSTKTGILPLGFKVLMNHGSFCFPVRREMCSTLTEEVIWSGTGVILRASPDSLVCSFVTVNALQLLEMNRDLPPVGGAFGVEDKGCLSSGGHLSMN